MYGYEWTDEYGIFRLTADAKLQKEIRPVFKEELDFFKMYEYWDYPDTTAPLLWAEGVRRYVMNGVCVAEAQGGGFYARPNIVRNTEERLQLQAVDTKRLYEVNKNLMKGLEQRAISFIRTQHDKYVSERYAFVCAFSGGKDSIVLLDLCAKALAPNEFCVIFSDTDMELSDTYKAVEQAKEKWPKLKFYEAKCHMAATESWDEFGPPATKNRWCCSIHKSVPTIIKLREITGQYNCRAVVFEGVRSEESLRRSKYEDVRVGEKNISQINCSPIIKWNSAEVFCYILANEILINKAYKYGLTRVGCIVCPMSSPWGNSIRNFQYKDEVEKLLSKVEDYARSFKESEKVQEYVDALGWKMRMDGRHLSNGCNKVTESISDNSVTYTIYSPNQSWFDVAPILGTVTEAENNHGVQRIDNISYVYVINNANDEADNFSITYRPFKQMDRYTISHLRSIANKVAYCIGCKACVVQCPTGAFTIQPGGRIQIRESSCIHCSNCMKFTDKGCMVAKSISIAQGGSTVDLKGIGAYKTFGLRQEFLDFFFNYEAKTFVKEEIEMDGKKKKVYARKEIGSIQLEALEEWAKQSGLLYEGKMTALGIKLKSFGAYNPFTWCIIWANLLYTSSICKWFCLNIDIGTTFDKGMIVEQLDNSFSERHRKNGASALMETLIKSPIGASLQQALELSTNNRTTTYLRDGWQMPDAVALLYSLYLYAEHTGRRAFTLTELIKVHDTPDAPGVSPADIYGLDNKKLRECIQGLALTFPDYIRVSFINDLDNIVLESKFSSLNILDLAEA